MSIVSTIPPEAQNEPLIHQVGTTFFLMIFLVLGLGIRVLVKRDVVSPPPFERGRAMSKLTAKRDS